VREWVAIVLFNKGVALGELHRAEEAVAVYDGAAAARFEDATEPVLCEQVAMAQELKDEVPTDDVGEEGDR
jgi:hypothetical protein